MTIPLRCVIDASVGIKRFVPDPLTPKVYQLFTHLVIPQTDFFIPDLFYIETANIFWKYVRAGLYAAADVPADLATLKTFPLRVVSTADTKSGLTTPFLVETRQKAEGRRKKYLS